MEILLLTATAGTLVSIPTGIAKYFRSWVHRSLQLLALGFRPVNCRRTRSNSGTTITSRIRRLGDGPELARPSSTAIKTSSPSKSGAAESFFQLKNP
jgi:hypothetical protein